MSPSGPLIILNDGVAHDESYLSHTHTHSLTSVHPLSSLLSFFLSSPLPPLSFFQGFCFLKPLHPPHPSASHKKKRNERKTEARGEGRNALTERMIDLLGGSLHVSAELMRKETNREKLKKPRRCLFFFLLPELKVDPVVCLLSEIRDPIRPV